MEKIRRCLNCMEPYEDHRDSCPFCGYRETKEWDNQLILEPGTILQGRYIVGTAREEGETDITYIGWDGLFDRKILIQEFFPVRLAKRDSAGKVLPVQGAEASLQKWTIEFIRQRENLIRFYESRNIICVYSAFRDNGTGYMTFQYADAPTLSEYIREHGPLSVSLAKVYLEQALNALQAVHGLGFIHGGISVDSFWMTQSGRSLVLKSFAEPCHSCGRTDLPDYGNAGVWTDVRGLAFLFAMMISGTTHMDEKSALSVIARTRMLSDVEKRTLAAALHAESGSAVSTLIALSKGILGERRTEELTSEMQKNPVRGRRYSKTGGPEELRRKILIGGTVLIVAILAAMAGVTLSRAVTNRTQVINSDSGLKENESTGAKDPAEKASESAKSTETAEPTETTAGTVNQPTQQQTQGNQQTQQQAQGNQPTQQQAQGNQPTQQQTQGNQQTQQQAQGNQQTQQQAQGNQQTQQLTTGESTDTAADTGESTDTAADTGESTDTAADTGESIDTTAGPGESTNTTAGPGESTNTTANPGESTNTTAGPGESTNTTAGQGESTETTVSIVESPPNQGETEMTGEDGLESD